MMKLTLTPTKVSPTKAAALSVTNAVSCVMRSAAAVVGIISMIAEPSLSLD